MALMRTDGRRVSHKGACYTFRMDQPVKVDRTAFKVFSSFEEAEAADREYERSLSPAERMQILLTLREHFSPYDDELTKGFKRVCRIIERS
jgi:hypothetical protein